MNNIQDLKGPELVEYIASEIRRVAASKGVDPYFLTKADILANSNVSEWKLRSVGGLSGVRKAKIPQSGLTQDLAGKREVAINKAYVSKLERELGDREYFVDALGKKVESALAKFPIKISNLKKPKHKPSKKKVQREIVAMISDTHFGLKVDQEEVPFNKLDWQIASRRMGLFAEQIADYKSHHRGSTPRLRLCLGGDLGQGVIHMDDSGTDLITFQFIGITQILTQMIDYLRNHFNEILVECTPCNHLRQTYRTPKRALKQKYDSYATMIHFALQAAFRSAPDVTFNVPKTPWTEWDMLGHRVFMTHGDTVFETGNPSSSINIGRLTEQINNLNANVDGKKFSVVMVGHMHTPLKILLKNGVWLIMNGTGSGIDAFAQSIGFFNNYPTQIIYESTPEWPVGDFRVIGLSNADSEAKYEKIVKPYDYSLILEK
jgi:hypothetical protein